MTEYPHLKKARVLIVDDVKEWREIARQSFEGTLAELHEATNGEEAIKTLLQAKMKGKGFDLLLLDLMMPQMNGFRVLQHVRSTPSLRHMGAVVTTVENRREDVLQCRKACVHGYILKPYKRERLLEEADRAIARSVKQRTGTQP